jgi:osmotically-inducible protein OsmY
MCRLKQFVLSGALALGALSTTACTTAPPRTSEERAADVQTAEQVEAALLADPRIYARHIDVRVDRGTVHLGGYVWASGDLLFAKNDAAAVSGVRGVADEMELLRGGVGGTSR